MNSLGDTEPAEKERFIHLIEEAIAGDGTAVEKQQQATKLNIHPLVQAAEEKLKRAVNMRNSVEAVLGGLPFDVMDPSGNTTCLIPVTFEQLAQDRANLVAKATELVDKGCVEQAGFYIETPEPDAEVDAVLEMAGGEFCLNATLSLASLLQSRAQKKFNRPLLIQCSGNSQPVRCTCVFGEANTPHVTAIFSADPVIETIGEDDGILVRLPGITHLICRVENLSAIDDDEDEQAKIALRDLAQRYSDQLSSTPAIGLIRFDQDDQGLVIRPTVLVINTGTIVSESACGSGTSALAFVKAKIAQEEQTDETLWQVGQPSGKWMTAQYKPKKEHYPTAAVSLETDVHCICSSRK